MASRSSMMQGHSTRPQGRIPRPLRYSAPFPRSTKGQVPYVTKQQVRNMIRSSSDKEEVKYKDVDLIATGVSDIGVLTDLTSVAQAVNVNSRLGDMLEIKSLEFRMTLTIGDTTNVGRVIIFQWSPITAPVAGNILQNSGVDYVTSQYQGASPDLYSILYDSGPFMLSGSFPIKCIVHKIEKFKSKFIEFNPTFTTGANKLYAFFVTDSTVVPTPLMSFESRLWFTDA